jgi:hypothetical protein
VFHENCSQTEALASHQDRRTAERRNDCQAPRARGSCWRSGQSAKQAGNSHVGVLAAARFRRRRRHPPPTAAATAAARAAADSGQILVNKTPNHGRWARLWGRTPSDRRSLAAAPVTGRSWPAPAHLGPATARERVSAAAAGRRAAPWNTEQQSRICP